MPGYVTDDQQWLRHQLKNTRKSYPNHHVPPTYGARVQFAELDNNTPLLPEERLKFIQQEVGVFLYYATAIENRVLVALSYIGSEQARTTSKTMDEVQQLLEYLTSNPTGMISNDCIGI